LGVPWLRFARIFLSVSKKPRVDLLATTRISIRIWPNDLDANMHVNNGRYLSLADLGRLDWFVRTGVYESAKRQRAFPVVGDCIAKYRRELKVFQRVDIESRLVGWSGSWGFLEHRFVREGRVVAMVGIRGAFRGANGTVDSWDFLAHLSKMGAAADPAAGVAAPGAAATNFPASPPLPAWAHAFLESAEEVSTMLRTEEKQGGS
jgi:acyl-CoA thioesterase FadM